MPSKNSINKPKDNLIRQRKSNLASKRRAKRSRQAITVIKQSNGETAIVPLANNRGGVIANTVISNKKAKKLERNLKYAKLRRDGSKKSGDVEMGEGVNGNVQDKDNVFRKELWKVVEAAQTNGVVLNGVVGEGTTLGSAAY